MKVSLGLSYEIIVKEVENFARKYQLENKLPMLPTKAQLRPCVKIIKENYQNLVADIKRYFDKVNADKNNALDHSLWVASVAGFIASDEINERNNQKRKIIGNVILSSLLHDIDRHLGPGEEHMIQGAKTAEILLRKNLIFNVNIVKTVEHHDDPSYQPVGSDEFKIIFSSVFDADHLRYGLEREKEFWEMKKRKGVKPEDVIHDYKWMVPYLNSWKTNYGKRVCKKWISYGYAIAKHVEEKFA